LADCSKGKKIYKKTGKKGLAKWLSQQDFHVNFVLKITTGGAQEGFGIAFQIVVLFRISKCKTLAFSFLNLGPFLVTKY
jgi:hypothetical protein